MAALQGKRGKLFATLRRKYRSERLGNKRDPVSELIYIALSRQTHERACDMAYHRLRRTFPSWEMLAQAAPEDVEPLIRQAGFGRQRAGQIVALARALRTRFGRVGLPGLRGLPPDEARSMLESLPGVGRKSANCVLLYCLGHAAIPVDVHTLRVAHRLGILSARYSLPRARLTQLALERAVPTRFWYSFHVGAVAIGRGWCFSTQPACGTCPLRSQCRSAISE